MDRAEYIFFTLNRDNYTYRKNDPKSTDTKAEYQKARSYWKDFTDNIIKESDEEDLIAERITQWQSNGNLTDFFWSCIKSKRHNNEIPCISLLAEKDFFKISTGWDIRIKNNVNQAYKQDNMIDLIPTWVQECNIDINLYRIWTKDLEKNITLNEFINNRNKREELINSEKDEVDCIYIGVIYTNKELDQNDDRDSGFIKDFSKYISDIRWFYDRQVGEKSRKYWLFNVYYKMNPLIWDKSKTIGIAAMQYEEGRETASAVTVNKNRIKQISVGDYVAAYTGDRGILAVGEVTREYYDEDNEELFINAGGAKWRQRIGVDWKIIKEEPIYYKGEQFKKDLGFVNEKEVMSSYTIFQITKEGINNIKRLLDEQEVLQGERDMEFGFTNFVKAKRFNFDEEVLKNYLLALKTKPFVILSGISGTGKTKIAQFFAEYMCPDEKISIDEFKEKDDEYSFKYKVKPYNLNHKQIIIPQRFVQLMNLPQFGSSKYIDVIFDGLKESCNLYTSAKGDYTQLGIRGELGKHLVDKYKVNDYFRVILEKHEDEDILYFDWLNPQKKEIIKKSERYCFISVRPDWVDNRSLLGFYNPITEKYQATELLKMMLRAKEDNENPYFVILDEMNLAKVEYYFSDFLSCLESRRIGSDGILIGESIILHDQGEEVVYTDENGKEYKIPNRIIIPENIYFTGTVNIDETTYMFSPKVLDRANVIEFNEVNLYNYKNLIGSNVISQPNPADKSFRDVFTDRYNYHKRLSEKNFDFHNFSDGFEHLININDILQRFYLHFGYRVVDEIMYYLYNADELKYFNILEALDYQILQKILPKMHGNRKKLEVALSLLLAYCFGKKEINLVLSQYDFEYLNNYDFDNVTPRIDEPNSFFNGKDLRFHHSAKKIYRMIKALRNNGFVSFIE